MIPINPAGQPGNTTHANHRRGRAWQTPKPHPDNPRWSVTQRTVSWGAFDQRINKIAQSLLLFAGGGRR